MFYSNDRVYKPAAHRGGSRYKEKYQALRENFDQVNAEHEDWERKLELANTRIKKLQAENDLLLDAISITVPATPSLLHLIRPSPTSMTPGSTPLHAQHQQATGQVPPHHMNGHTYSHSNGKYREKETDRLEIQCLMVMNPRRMAIRHETTSASYEASLTNHMIF
ncbi:hypothetical protein V8B97DRAFT_1916807 [Scleroderma yunnanense]